MFEKMRVIKRRVRRLWLTLTDRRYCLYQILRRLGLTEGRLDKIEKKIIPYLSDNSQIPTQYLELRKMIEHRLNDLHVGFAPYILRIKELEKKLKEKE